VPDPTKPPRRFPPPWAVEDKDAYFIVRDHNGQAAEVKCETSCVNDALVCTPHRPSADTAK
jgi:hypothetical protein